MNAVAASLMPGNAAASLTGIAGIGKTTIAHASAALTADSVALIHVSMIPRSPNELIRTLLTESSVDPKDFDQAECVSIWTKLLVDWNSEGKRAAIVVENADQIRTQVLHALHTVTVGTNFSSPGANVLLTGSSTLENRLQDYSLAALSQRVRARYRLSPLSCNEMSSLISRELARVGGEASHIFASGSLELIHSYSDGIPRVAQYLCESALCMAATSRESTVTAKMIRDVALMAELNVERGEDDEAAANSDHAAGVELSDGEIESVLDESIIPVLSDSVGDELGYASTPPQLPVEEQSAASFSSQDTMHNADVASTVLLHPPRELPIQDETDDSRYTGYQFASLQVYDEDEYAKEIEEALRGQNKDS